MFHIVDDGACLIGPGDGLRDPPTIGVYRFVTGFANHRRPFRQVVTAINVVGLQ
jgi:hypothetical protein